MMKFLRFLPILLFAVNAHSATLITATVTITNLTTNGQTFAVNSNIRTWTNNTPASALTFIITTNGAGPTATNLYQHILAHPYSAPSVLVAFSSTNVITLRASTLTVTPSAGWATVSYITNTGPLLSVVQVPFDNVDGATNRTNNAHWLVDAFNTYIVTNAFKANATVMSNFPNLYSNATIAGNLTLTGTNTLTNSSFLGGRVVNALLNVTNAVISNAVIHSLTMTNGANYGNAFRSPSSYPNADQFGSSAGVSGGNAIAVGPSAAAATNGTALGYLSSAGMSSVSLGMGADTSGCTNCIAIFGSVNQGSNQIAIGPNAVIPGVHDYSMALGPDATTTTNLQIMLGASYHTTVIPGLFAPSGTSTNLTIRGTNVINGRLDFTSRANTGLANGLNPGVVLGTNVFIRLSGATTIGAISGFAAEQDGSFHIVQMSGAITNILCNESSALGTDPTVQNRIVTGTGSDVSFTNSPTVFGIIYDATASKWKLTSFTR